MSGQKQCLDLGLYHIRSFNDNTAIVGIMRQGQKVDDNKANEEWKLLRKAIRQIQDKQFSHLPFEELYRHAYYLVVHKHGRMLYNGLREIILEFITHKVKPRVIDKLHNNLLLTLNNCWRDHQRFLFVISDVLMYLDRVYVNQNDLEDVQTLGTNLFKDLVVCSTPDIQPFIQDTLLSLIMNERCGDEMDRTNFKSTLEMLMTLGINSSHVYKENFEVPFLRQSTKYFQEVSEQLLKENNASLYLRRVDSLIDAEMERADHCYNIITRPPLEQLVHEELIRERMETIVEMNSSGVVHMIQNQMTEDLSLMYKLLGFVPNGLVKMFSCVSRYLREQGQALVWDENNNNNALIYVQNLLNLKERIDFYLINALANDKQFKQMIASDFEFILNCNPKTPEYLSIFIDEKLKKTLKGMTDDDKMLLLEKAVVLFRFLQDKDMFEQYYKQHLAKRLLLNKPINVENENNVISMFKGECGFHYTRKMEGMFRDIWTSAAFTDEFQKHVEDSGDPVHGMELSVRVLTAVYWPTHYPPPPLTLPAAPLTAFQTFKKFYLSRHCGRQLTLLPQLGSAEIEAYFNNPPLLCEDREGHQSYTLQVSTYQMCVLMLFNSRPRWTFQELQTETNLPSRDLHRALQGLIQGKLSQKILVKQPDTRKIETHDTFDINVLFSSKVNRVKILPLPAKCETETERQHTIKRVTIDRNHEVEAAIIRIMKARRVIYYDELMNEVMTILSARFVPSRDIIKTRIEVLIEREYIARNVDDRRLFEYIA